MVDEAAVVSATLEPPPERLGVTHWSTRLLGAELGISHVWVGKIWRRWGLQPWRAETFKFSTDPQLEAKVRDVVGLYLNPPDKAIVLCVDEKSQVQALDRTAPTLPMRLGLPEKQTHDYIRHGTTTLFAALEIATGRVEQACLPRHRHQEFLAFLKQVAKAYPRRKLHLVVDNYATHNHPAVRAWSARNPRITLHFTPTSGSWLNMVEIFFSIITRQAIRRGSFGSVKELIAAIGTFIDGWNERCHPFVWTKPADELLDHCRPGQDCFCAPQVVSTILPSTRRSSIWVSASAAFSSGKRAPIGGSSAPERRCGTSSSHSARGVAGPAEGEGAPADAHDVDVVEQQPVDLDRGDLARGEADHQQPPERAQAAQRVGEAVAADRVHDEVDPAQLLDGVAEALDGHGVRRPDRPGHLGLGVAGHDGDHGGAERRRQLHAGRADPARRAVHEHGLARLQVAPHHHGEVRGEVVHRQTRARLEGDVVGQREDGIGIRGGDLRERARAAERHHPVARRERRAVRHLPHRARDLGAQRERQLGLVLVEALRLQDVREVHPGRGDVDEHLLRAPRRLRHLPQLDRRRSVQPHHLYSAHARHRTRRYHSP